MSSSEGGKVADALVVDLNAASLSKSFTAAVGYGLRLKLEDADTLKVDVAPVQTTAERQTRGNIAWANAIDVGVRFRFGSSDQDATTGKIKAASVDAYRYLLQEIVAWAYGNTRLTTYTNAVLSTDAEVRADVIQKHFEEWNQFTGIVRLTYMTVTEIA